MIFSIGRSATSRLVSGAFARSARSVALQPTAKSRIQTPCLQVFRGFASVGRPKAAATSKGEQSTAKKPTAKKKTAKKTKATSKPKPKPKRVKILTPAQKARQEKEALKQTALFHEPKRLPVTAFMVFASTRFETSHLKVTTSMPVFAEEFKTLPDHQVKEFESIAIQNQAANKSIYKSWVESYTPEEIHKANVARRALKRKYNFPKAIKSARRIRDERHRPQRTSPYILYCQARRASGDFQKANPVGTIRALSAEWRNLTEVERQPYQDQFRSVKESLQAGSP